jgi:hypothetical protein
VQARIARQRLNDASSCAQCASPAKTVVYDLRSGRRV